MSSYARDTENTERKNVKYLVTKPHLIQCGVHVRKMPRGTSTMYGGGCRGVKMRCNHGGREARRRIIIAPYVSVFSSYMQKVVLGPSARIVLAIGSS